MQLLEGWLTDSSYYPVASAIPYSFHDVQSYTDLYYSSASNKLIVVTLLYTKEEEKIYTVDSPPEALDAAPGAPVGEQKQRSYLLYLILPGGQIQTKDRCLRL